MSSKSRIDVDAHSPNSPAEGSGKRRRAIVACTTCRRRKIRCDATKPFCGNCHRAGIECVYPAEARRKRPKVVRDSNTSQSDDISRRMERLEDMMKLMLEKHGIKSPGGGDDNYDSDDSMDSSKSSDDDDDDDNCTPNSDKDALLHNHPEYNATYDDPRDVLRLQQRRAPVVFKIGEFEPFVTYSYGFTTALLSPKSMGWLCSRVGNSELGHDAETLLTRLWKKRSEEFSSIGCLNKQTYPIDPELIAHGLELRNQLKSEVFDLLLTDEDVAKIEMICNPHRDLSRVDEESPYSIYNAACALVATCFSAKLDPNLSRFPLNYINTQYTNAFNICMQKVARMTWYPTTFLLLRLLVFVAYVLSQSAAFVQIRSILSVIIARSLTLGLHSKDLMAYLSEEEQQRRALVWALIQDLDVKMSSVLSMVPLLINVNQKPFKLNRPDPHGDLRVMIESTGLNKIYGEVFTKLFSIKARKKSTKQILMTILKLDEKLKRWKESLPSSFTNFTNLVQYNKQLSQVRSNPGSQYNSPQSEGRTPDGKEQVRFSRDICSSWMRSTTIVCYHNIRMLLYSIPAFSPSCLSAFDNDPEGVPATLRRSIDVIAECANSSLNYAFMASGFYNSDYLAMTATNSFSALFLKQVRDPRHPTNHSDLQGILRRIDDFRDIAQDHRDVVGTLKLWNLFASTLKELNRNCNRQDMPQAKRNSFHSSQMPDEGIALKPLQNSNMSSLPSFSGPQLPALNPQSPRNVSSPAEPAHPVHPNLIQPCPTMPLTNGYGSPSPIPMVPPPAPYASMPAGVPFMPPPPPPPPLHMQRPYPFGSDLHIRSANGQAYTPQFTEHAADNILPTDTLDKMRASDAFNSPRSETAESSNTPNELWDTFNGLNNSGLEDLMSVPAKDDSFDGNNTGETPTNCVIC